MSLERLQSLIDRVDALIARSRRFREEFVGRKHGPTVTVYVNGESVRVPERVDCHYAARGALGAPRRSSIAHEKTPRESLSFRGGYVFTEGERFVYHMDEFPRGDEEGEEELDEVAEPWAADPDGWREGRPPLS